MVAKSSARRSAKQNKSKQNAKQHEANNKAKRSNLRSPTRATGRHNDKLVVVSCFAPRCLSFPFAACLDLLRISHFWLHLFSLIWFLALRASITPRSMGAWLPGPPRYLAVSGIIRHSTCLCRRVSSGRHPDSLLPGVIALISCVMCHTLMQSSYFEATKSDYVHLLLLWCLCFSFFLFYMFPSVVG